MATPKKTSAPKKPKTPISYYIQQCIKDNVIEASSSYKDRWTHARRLYSELSDEEKIKFISMSIEDEKRYEKEAKEYKLIDPDFKAHQSQRGFVTKSERDLFDRLNGRPTKPPNCGYILFSRIVIPLLKGQDPVNRMVTISQLWKRAPDLVKAQYEFEAQKANFEYLTAIDEYVSKMSHRERKRIFEEENIKYPSRKKLQTMRVAIDASEEANDMNFDRLIAFNGLEEDAVVFFSYQKLLKKMENEPTYDGDHDLIEARREWLSLDENDKSNFLRKVYTCRLINSDTERQSCGKLQSFLPSEPVTGSVKSDLEALKQILHDRPKGKVMNGYALFVSRKLNDATTETPRARLKTIAQMWNDLSETEKDEHNIEAKVANGKLGNEQEDFEASLSHQQRILYTHYLKKYRKRRCNNNKLMKDMF